MRSHAKVAVVVAALTSFLALAPPAFAAKTVDRFVGGPSGGGTDALGGVFNFTGDVAVNESGAGGAAPGDVYVSDQGNDRVQVFSATGAFKFAIGRDVIAAGKAGDLGDSFEKCTVATDCKAGSSGSEADAPAGEIADPFGLAIDQDTGDLYVIDRGNRRVQQLTASGSFVRAWGWGVATGASAFEVCTSGCQRGIAGAGLGQLGTDAVGVAVTPPDGNPAAGSVYVADPANNRVQSFNLDGTSPAAFGSAGSGVGEFGSNMPQHVAVDSAGIVYASDRNESARINRYDTVGAAFLAPISSPPLLEGESESTTSGLEVDPDPDGGGADVDRLYVLRNPSSGNTVVQQLDEPGLVSPPAAVAETHMPTEFGEGFAAGLGIDASVPSKLFVSSFFGSAGHGFFVLDDDGTGSAISTSITSPSDITPTSATLNGSVDPDAGLVRYHFEYSADGSNWTALPEQSIEGSGDQPVSQSATGLVPHTLYRVRLVATKVLGPEDLKTVISSEALLLTAVAAPTVETRPVHQYDDTSAWLVADVNPNNQSTTYRFEWGRTTSYGSSLPVPNAQAGSGGAAKAVMQKLSGLSPGTTYHYRIVATNDTGTSKGADRSFTTRPAFTGFEERAYEQVTPQDKLNDIGMGDADPGTTAAIHAPALPVAENGNAVAFETLGSLGGEDWGQGGEPNTGLAQRTPSGWLTDPIRPEVISKSSTGAVFTGFGGPDLSRQLFLVPFFGLEGGDPTGIYLQDSDANSRQVIAELGADAHTAVIGWASTDFGHVGFDTSEVLTDDPGVPSSGTKAYETTEGEVRLVAVQADGTPFPEASRIGGGSGQDGSSRNAVSGDGNHIFFTTPQPFSVTDESRIYRRDFGTSTILVSPTKRTPPDPAGPQAKRFLDATSDQSASGPAAVFFASKEKLTNQPTNTSPTSSAFGDLYRYEVNTDTLTNVSAETNDPGGAEVLGMIGRSDDGQRVFYVARGRVVAGRGIAGEPNLYLWRDDGTDDGATTFIATLANESCDAATETPGTSGTDPAARVGDGCNFTTESFGTWTDHASRATADGEALLFQSAASLTGYENEGHNQLYLYNADANGGPGQLTCVSCNPSGAPAQADALLPARSTQGFIGDGMRSMSSDGRRVFFMTSEALLPADGNGKLDVYAWEAGHLELVSSGTDPYDTLLYGASADGDDAFFKTRQSLVGIDDDGGLYDVYDARVGGGIAAQNPPSPGVPCVGEACKGPPVVAPPTGTPASSSSSGTGNVGEPPRTRRCPKGKRVVRRGGKARCVKRRGKKQQGARKSTHRNG